MSLTRTCLTLSAFALLAQTACSDVTGPDRPQGTYELVEIQGYMVPVHFTSPDVPGVDGFRTLYQSSTIVIDGRSVHFTLSKSMEWPFNVWEDVFVEHEHAELVGRSGHFQITDQTDGSDGMPPMTNLRMYVEFWRADSLMINGEAGEMLYLRQ